MSRPPLLCALLLSVLCCAAALAAPPARAEVKLLDRILAVAGDESVLLSEFNTRYAMLNQRLQQSDQPPPTAELRRQLLDQMVLERLQLQSAARSSIHISDRELNVALSRIAADQGLDLEGMIDQLDREGGDYVAMRQQLREQMAIERVQAINVRRRAQLSSDELQAYLDSPAGAQLRERRYHLLQLSAPLDADASAGSKMEARALLQRVRSRAQQSDLLRAAEGESALRVTDLQWRSRAELPYLFESVVAGLDIGEIVGPVHNDSGLHMIQLIGRRGHGEMVPELRVRHLLLQPSELRNAAETRAELVELRRRLLAGEDFAVLAQQYSEDAHSRPSGGELGWLRARQVVPRFAAAMLAQETGTLSEIVESTHGFHLLKVLERRQIDVTEEEVRRRAAELLYQRRYPVELKAWLDELRDRSYVEIRW